ncbi:LOB domain-containing protein 25-like isoform X1 [Solanum stenotomum]|uniref:LOB domain-containing protein 25-like isoform X1 n=1 Tax=Solanum stenotomum TaxID=172797 RepID=UPI0020D1DEA1|nr:LOB domain-containing protein 25-like isoform X1 [Solanum stenotomum]
MNSRLSKKNKHMPCSACKLLRRRCTKDCIFLPHFPPAEPHKFIVVHRIFGASNITKMLQQEIPMDNREDAVISMVYEATARLRDPVYGSVGIISALQKHIFHLQSELNEASAEAMSLRTQLSNASTSLPSSLLEVSPFTPENHEFHHSQKSSQQNAYSNNDLQLLLPEAADYCFQETDQVLPLPY